MRKVAVSTARHQLQQLFESVIESRLPVLLTSHNASAILVSWDDWHAIEQTMYRLSMPRLGRRAAAHGEVDERN